MFVLWYSVHMKNDSDNVDEPRIYSAFSIPPRALHAESRSTDEYAPNHRDKTGSGFFDEVQFAEIEYGVDADDSRGVEPGQNTVQTTRVGAGFGTVPASEPLVLGSRQVDPIKERFGNMRALYRMEWQAKEAGGLATRTWGRLFYILAKYMDDFEDDYTGFSELNMASPSYQHMSYDQLRTYFTWRTEAREGRFLPISVSYLFLYVYELINGVGYDHPIDGFDMLIKTWDAYRNELPLLNRYLPAWVKDFYVYYDLPGSFTDLALRHELQKYYPELFLFVPDMPNRLEIFNGFSSYNITKSKFYTDENRELIHDCFDAVFEGFKALCNEKGIRIEHLFSLGFESSSSWNPFASALFYDWYQRFYLKVELPGGETYRFKDNRWTADIVVPEQSRKDLFGYTLRKMELCLRNLLGYKFKITAKPGLFVKDLMDLGITQGLFDQTIETAVKNHHRELNRTIVEVDMNNLDKIRAEALVTQDRLIVLEGGAADPGLKPRAGVTGNVSKVSAADAPTAPVCPVVPAVPITPPLPVVQPKAGDIWTSLVQALSTTELQALRIIVNGEFGESDIKTFADANSIMLEVLLDNINEKATDAIGDAILETGGGVEVFQDYLPDVLRVLEGGEKQ